MKIGDLVRHVVHSGALGIIVEINKANIRKYAYHFSILPGMEFSRLSYHL